LKVAVVAFKGGVSLLNLFALSNLSAERLAPESLLVLSKGRLAEVV